MTEQEGKEVIKFLIDSGYRKLTKQEKEVIKSAVDRANNFDELFQTLFSCLTIEANR